MQGTPTSVAMTDGTDRVAPEHWQPRGVTPVEGARERQRGWQLLGQVLVKRGLLSQEQLAAAFERQRRGAQRLGRVLVDLNMISEPALLECLAQQFNKPLMSEEELASLEPEVVRILPEETARLNTIIAIEPSARQPVVATPDIPVEPLEDRTLIRARIDGLLYELLEVPRPLHLAVVSRLKIISRLDIAERRLPQDGSFSARVEDTEIDFRVSTLPSIHGEKIVLRLLLKEAVVRHYTLESLGFDPDQLTLFRDAIRRPWGMILMTGPTGSGKSTTLHTALKAIKSPRKNIVTVEDPVEYRQPGIQQVQVKSEIGFDFARSLRAILRQDPDVIMIGEIRDSETAQIAVRAALTGHLVFSSVHANDAVSSIVRPLPT